jgi:hypothetical protein
VVLRLFLLFVVSFVSNATAFFGASYTLIATTELSATGVSFESFALVVFVTALGATCGKIVIYLGALGLHSRLLKNKNVRLLGRWLGRGGFYLGLFVTALLPILPFDDYVYIGAGANRGRLAPMLGVTFIAKLAKSAFEILLELSGLFEISRLTHHVLGLSRLEFSIVGSAALVVVGVAAYVIDWEPFARWVSRLLERALSVSENVS